MLHFCRNLAFVVRLRRKKYSAPYAPIVCWEERLVVCLVALSVLVLV